MTSRHPRHARLVKRRRRLPPRPSATTRRRCSSHRRRPAQRARHRLAKPRLSRGRLRRPRRPPRLSRRLPRSRRPPKLPPRRHLNLLLRPSRLRRSRRAPRRRCRRLAPHRPRARRHRRVPRRRCRRHGGWSPRAARNPRGRFCRHPGVRQRARRNRQRLRGQRRTRRPDPHCRRLLPVCRCRRSLPTAGRSRRRLRRPVRDPESRSPRRRVLPAHQHAAGGRIALDLPVGSDVPPAAAIVRTEVGQAAGAPTPERRRPPVAVLADPPAVLVREGRGGHREAVHEADRAGAVVASARNCSLSSSPPTRRWMRRFPRARSSWSADRQLKKWPPG